MLLQIPVRTKLLKKRVQTSLVLCFNNSRVVGNNSEESGCIFLQAYLCADLLFTLPSLYHDKKSERNSGNVNVFSWHLRSEVVVKEMEVPCGKENLYCF